MSRILDEFHSTPWAIIPSHLQTIAAVLHRWSAGMKLTEAEIINAVGSAPVEAQARRNAARSMRGVAVIPVYGPLAQRGNVQDISGPGVTSTQRLAATFREALADSSADSIVFDIDSPGGAVSGISELAAEIREARGKKPIIAHANSLAASAAYYIASAADEIVVTPGGQVGSIGVFASHQDVSAALENEGVKITLISAGEHKVEANPYEPLTDEARATMQSMVDQYYDDFVSAVASGRGVTNADVLERYGQGRVFTAKDALGRGMVDRIESFDQTISRLRAGEPRRSGFAARKRRLDIESLAT